MIIRREAPTNTVKLLKRRHFNAWDQTSGHKYAKNVKHVNKAHQWTRESCFEHITSLVSKKLYRAQGKATAYVLAAKQHLHLEIESNFLYLVGHFFKFVDHEMER